MSPKDRSKNVGILGGGQLGCMLTDAALALGLNPRIYTEANAPAAALFADRVTLGAMEDTAQLKTFFNDLPIVAFENEFLDCDLLESAAQGLPLRFAPDLPAIRELQDKLRQKEILNELGLPTAEFLPIRPGDEVAQRVQKAYARFNGQVVFKWARMGYDGKGVCLAKDTPSGREEAVRFCKTSLDRGVPVYAEAKIAFKRELAIIGCRSLSGAFTAYPLVVSEQQHGICKRVTGPATSLGVPAALEIASRQAAQKLADAMRLEGAFALELFETEHGSIAINEIAPRVHNSGHYTQDACLASQFENHWRSILDLPWGSTETSAGFVMLNLLGPEGVTLSLPRARVGLPFPQVTEPLRLHWYGKSEIRPWRKVGHINAALTESSTISAILKTFNQYEESWDTKLRELQKNQGTST